MEAAANLPGGQATLTNICLSEISDGLYLNANENGPIFWELGLHDDGVDYDRSAGDGVFTSYPAGAGMLIDTLNEVTVRAAR